MFKNKTILITGGTGSFGKALSQYLIKNFDFKKLIIFSRDELKQFEMKNTKPYLNHKKVRFFIGDIRDAERLKFAFKDVDLVIHAAALKQVTSSEYNPFETIKTNVVGSQNVITAAIEQDVNQVIALSTDKACSPLNLYGATKLCSEKLFVNANNISGNKKIMFSVLRYGNVNGSRGSVMPLFLENIKNKKELFVTDERMTRFAIKMQSAIDMVLWGIKNFYGGEILVPKIPSYKIIDLCKALNKNYKILGIRVGEKIHEDLISFNESLNLLENEKYFIILRKKDKKIISHYKKKSLKIIKKQFQYSSGTNSKFLTINELRVLLQNLND